MDEVTGALALSAEAHEMIEDEQSTYVISLPFPVGSVVKYRYSRRTETAPVEEYTSAGGRCATACCTWMARGR